MPQSSEIEQILAAGRTELKHITDTTAQEILAAYAKGVDDIKARYQKLVDAAAKGDVSADDARKALLPIKKAAERDMQAWADIASGTMDAKSKEAFLSGCGFAGDVGEAKSIGFRLTTSDRLAFQASYIATRSGPLRELLNSIALDTADAVALTMRNSILASEGTRALAKRLEIATSASAARCDLIARTEVARAYREATLLSYEQMGAQYVQWMSAEQTRTCSACWAMDGKVFEMGHVPNDHPRGRCKLLVLSDMEVESYKEQYGDDWQDAIHQEQLGTNTELLKKKPKAELDIIFNSPKQASMFLAGAPLQKAYTVVSNAKWGRSVRQRVFQNLSQAQAASEAAAAQIAAEQRAAEAAAEAEARAAARAAAKAEAEALAAEQAETLATLKSFTLKSLKMLAKDVENSKYASKADLIAILADMDTDAIYEAYEHIAIKAAKAHIADELASGKNIDEIANTADSAAKYYAKASSTAAKAAKSAQDAATEAAKTERDKQAIAANASIEKTKSEAELAAALKEATSTANSAAAAAKAAASQAQKAAKATGPKASKLAESAAASMQAAADEAAANADVAAAYSKLKQQAAAAASDKAAQAASDYAKAKDDAKEAKQQADKASQAAKDAEIASKAAKAASKVAAKAAKDASKQLTDEQKDQILSLNTDAEYWKGQLEAAQSAKAQLAAFNAGLPPAAVEAMTANLTKMESNAQSKLKDIEIELANIGTTKSKRADIKAAKPASDMPSSIPVIRATKELSSDVVNVAEAVKRTGWQGRSMAIDANAIEDQNVLVYEIDTPKGKQTRISFKVASGPAQSRLEQSLLDGGHDGINVTRSPISTEYMSVNKGKIVSHEVMNNFWYTMRSNGSGGGQYNISGDGFRAAYIPSRYAKTSDRTYANVTALRGQMNIIIDGEATPQNIQKALDAASAIGINAQPATAADKELAYLRMQGAAANDTSAAYKKAVAKANRQSPQNAVATLKQYWSDKLGIDIDTLPSYRPEGEYVSSWADASIAGGRRQFKRFDIDEDEFQARIASKYRVFTSLEYGGGAKQLPALRMIMENSGALVSTTEKLRIGVPLNGASPFQDLNTGGAAYVFTRITEIPQARIDRGYAPMKGLYFKPDLLKRMDAISYDRDNYGNTSTPEFIQKNRKSSINEWISAAQKGDNETIFKDAIKIIDNLDVIVVYDDRERMDTLQVLRDNLMPGDLDNDGRLKDGRRLEDLIITQVREQK